MDAEQLRAFRERTRNERGNVGYDGFNVRYRNVYAVPDEPYRCFVGSGEFMDRYSAAVCAIPKRTRLCRLRVIYHFDQDGRPC